MGTHFRALAAALAIGLVVPIAPAAAKTRKASVSGAIGVTAPAGGASVVRAVSLADRSIVAARRLKTNGAFSLSLPAGSYLVVGSVVAKSAGPTTKQLAVTLRSGQKRTKARLTAKLRTAKKKPRARAAYKTAQGSGRTGVSAVGVNAFAGPPESAGDLHYLAKGAASLLTVDLASGVAKQCPSKVVVHEVDPEVIRALEAEATLGRSPYADPSSFPPQRRIISTVRVDGVITPDGTSRVTVKDTGTGEIVTTLTEPLGTDPFAALSRQAAKLTDILCARVGGYDVKLDLKATATSPFDYTSSASFAGTLVAEPVTTNVWSGRGEFQWADPVFTPTDSCVFSDPVTPLVAWSAQVRREAGDKITVSWSAGGYDHVTATRDCPPAGPNTYDPPPDPRASGPHVGSPQPLSFTLPASGGTKAVSGASYDGKVIGTLTVRRVRTP